MNTINEFDLYQKTQMDNKKITNIKVDFFKDKFSLSIKESKNSDWVDVLNKKNDSLFFSKPHLFILLKSIEFPFDLLEKLEKNESVEFANGAENLIEEKGITSFLENSNYITFLKEDDINKILKKVFSKLQEKEESKINGFSIYKKNNSVYLESPSLRGNSIKIDYEGDSLFQIKSKRFFVLNDEGREIFSSNAKKFPIEKNIAKEFLKLSKSSQNLKQKIK